MARIASEALVERLIDWGVDTVFGLPGDGINGIMEGLRRHQDKLKFVLVHHEEAAAFMAVAHAKATGKLGVCLATSGPGGIHLLNGLYDAKLDHVPVLAITGMQETSLLGTGYQQEVALFLTAVQYQLPVKVVINNNNALGQILWEQMVLGYPEHGVRYPEPFADYAAFATANGALGAKVTKPGELAAAVQLALNHPGPALLDVNVNPAEPPLPGKVQYDQAKNFALAFLRGQPHRATIATTLLKDRIQQLGS